MARPLTALSCKKHISMGFYSKYIFIKKNSQKVKLIRHNLEYNFGNDNNKILAISLETVGVKLHSQALLKGFF